MNWPDSSTAPASPGPLASQQPPGPATACLLDEAHLPADPRKTDPAAVPLRLADLVWHEICEPGRLERLKESLRFEALREGIHVAAGALPIILDGAHRSRAAQSLGHPTIPAHIVPIPDGQPVPGWTHDYHDRVPAGLHTLRRTGEGPVIATIHRNGLTQDVRAANYSTAALHDAYWHVAHVIADATYTRTSTAPMVGAAITWILPTWSTVARIAIEHGPLPAGVTRLGDVFRQLCPICLAQEPQPLTA